MASPPLLQLTESGLYCAPGDFYLDPWRPVSRAVISHGHSDHARFGHAHYLTATPGVGILKSRVGEGANIQALPYGEATSINGVRVSFHPAGHVLGSAQIRLEWNGAVWVFSGDYKVDPDPTCAPFEPVRCDTFVTESTFGLPIYRWRPQAAIFDDINQWWRHNQTAGKASLLLAYGLGKAQRLLAGIDPSIGPIFIHGAITKMNARYREAGVPLPATQLVHEADKTFDWRQALIVAPPSAARTPWARRFTPYSDAFVSGWMLIRGARRRRSVDRGFALSDHADWPGLLSAIAATQAENILVTHGFSDVLAKYLNERGLNAAPMHTQFEGEQDDTAEIGEELPLTA